MNQAPTPEQIEQNNKAREAIYREQSEMRTKLEKVTCDLCAKACNVTIPGADPHDWVSFWDVDQHGMDDKERIVCDTCANEIVAAVAKNTDMTND